MYDDKISMMLGRQGTPNPYNLASTHNSVNAFGYANEQPPVDSYRVIEQMHELVEKIKILKNHTHQLHQAAKGAMNFTPLLHKLHEAEALAGQLHRKATTMK